MSKKLLIIIFSFWIIGPIGFLIYRQNVLIPKNANMAYKLGNDICYSFYNKCSHSSAHGVIKTDCSSQKEELIRVESLPSDLVLTLEFDGIKKFYSKMEKSYFYQIEGREVIYSHKNLNEFEPKIVSNVVVRCDYLSYLNYVDEN